MVINKSKVFIILIIILAIIIKVMSSTNNNIESYLRDNGFVLEEDGSALYRKKITDLDVEEFEIKMSNKEDAVSEIMYFNINNYQLSKKKLGYEDEIFITFVPKYDYTSNMITYNYRIVYNNSSLIFSGDYNVKNQYFTCDNEYNYNFDAISEKNVLCDRIEDDVLLFKDEVLELVDIIES